MLSEKNLKDISDIQRNLRKNTVMNCWHINEYESAAMWRLYLKSDEGVAIQSTFKRLKDSLNSYPEDVYIGQVKYVDYKRNIIPEGNLFYPYTHKRKSFEYERELRAVIGEMPVEAGKFDSKKELFDVGAYIPVYLDVLVERIFLPPQAPDWFGELVKSIIEKYDLKKEVVQSNLDEDPVY